MGLLSNTSLLSQINVGMVVIDAAGEHIGQVLYVAPPARRGDEPQPEPTAEDDSHNPLDRAEANARTFETELPKEVIDPLRRYGFIQVGQPDQATTMTLYASSQDIDHIDDQTVALKLEKVKLTAL